MSTTIALTGGVEARLDHMAAQLDELTQELHRQRAQRDMLAGLLADANHLTGPAMTSLTQRLEVAEEKGYLDFARSSLGVVDRVVTSFDSDDVAALGDNIVLILETVKEMTQPEIMTMLRRTAHLVNEPGAAPAVPPSMLALLREMRDPQVRAGLARLLILLRSLADPAPPTAASTTPSKEA